MLVFESVFASGNRRRNEFDRMFGGLKGKAIITVFLASAGFLTFEFVYLGNFFPSVYESVYTGEVVYVKDSQGNLLDPKEWYEVLNGRYEHYFVP